MTRDLNPAFTFDTLVVGANNRLAVTAARTASEAPGASYNPLFIYSQTGLGKTHLLMAIGQHATESTPGINVEYWTLHEFVDAFHTAVSAGDVGDFRRRVESDDVVLLDDVQFLSHTKEMQAELLRLAVELQRVEKQLVLTSDRPPSEIADLDDRLLEQLGGGLVVDIGVPEFETRLAILQQRALSDGLDLSHTVLTAVAEVEAPHVRALLGILNRIHAFQSVSDRALTAEEARALAAGESVNPAGPPAPAAAAPVAGIGGGEFGQFLSDMAVTVTQQVDGWRDGIRNAIQEWSARGYATEQLERLLQEDVPGGTDAEVRAYEAAVERLRGLEAEVASYDPSAAANPVFKMPDRVEEAEQIAQQARANFVPPAGPSDVYTLEQFVLGDSTRMAIEAGRAVIERPGAQYNPLTIVGPPGSGKTHLLHGIGRALRDVAGLTVACLSSEAFVEELVYAIEQGAVPTWRARYRYPTAFLLDDVHKVGQRGETQEELFQLFNLFADAGRQLVFTSTTLPQDIEGMDERLQSRLAVGLTTTIDAPDLALRSAVLSAKLTTMAGAADTALVEYLAKRDTESVRAMLELVDRVVTGAEAMGRAPSVEVAKGLLESTQQAARRPSVSGIRTSAVMVAPSKSIQSREKVVWEWPDPMDRLIAELA